MRYRAPAASPNELEPTEHALVDETQLGAVVEVEQDPRVAQLGVLGPVHPELSAHPQVGDHGVIAQDQPEVLAPACDGVNAPARQIGDETLRAGGMGTHGAGMKDGDRFDLASFEVVLQAPAHHLDLREFRHLAAGSGRLRGRPAARRVSCWRRPPTRRPFRPPWRWP